MFIRLQGSKHTDRVQVHLVEGYRDERGKVMQRVLKRYGELHELQASEPGIIERLKTEAREATRVKAESKAWIELDLGRARHDTDQAENIGWFFLDALWRELGLDKFFKARARERKIDFDLDGYARLLVFHRVLAPGSKAAAVRGAGWLHDGPAVSRDDTVYKALDVLHDFAPDCQRHLHKQVCRVFGRDVTRVFYDVTNYWFETDVPDELRKKGPSKEHRLDPIVQMGLVMDNQGLPVAYRLFPGNTHDARTLVPVLEDLQVGYGLPRMTVVADKGLNSGANLAAIIGAGNGYIVAQKVRGKAPPDIVAAVLDPNGWTASEDNMFAYKSITRRHHLAKGVDVEEKCVCFWSAKYAAREKRKRGLTLADAQVMVDNPARYEASANYGRKRYIHETIATTSGEIASRHLSLDKAKAETDALLDGYYAIITTETSLHDTQVIDAYHQLARIEESFRVLKTDLEGRPVYVWTTDHIDAHFLTCYLALTLIRATQAKTGWGIPATQIKQALASALITPIENGIWAIEKPTDTHTMIEAAFGVSLPTRYARHETIRAYRRQIRAAKD